MESNVSLKTYHHYISELNSDSLLLDTEVRYKKLMYIIRVADEYYYKLDNPLLSDSEYDTYFSELKKIETEHPEWISSHSPTQKIFNAKRTELNQVRHMVPMLSLENSYNANDLIEWDKKNKAALGHSNFTYTIEPKYDGAGISLVYSDNLLTIAATRGDGVSGEDISHNVSAIPSIPVTIQNSDGITFEVRGEVVIKKDDFLKVNSERQAEGLNVFANPRNAASGSLRMLNPQETKKRKLHAILYHISYIQSEQYQQWQESHYATIKQLHELGFVTPYHEMKVCKDIHEVIEYSQQIEAQRDSLPYEIDGMVVKINETNYQDDLGQTTHHPRWAMAIKFKAKQATSILENVEFQVGRTGTITPVAKIKPVALGGVTISSISLFNEENILLKDIQLNDTVLIERAGDVIPYIVKSIPELRSENAKPIVFPSECPVCSHQLHKSQDEAVWRCQNPNCEAQIIERIKHFVSKDAMDIRSLGEANIKRFYELGFIKSIADIYRLPYDKISELEKFGVKSVENLQKAIENSKTQNLHRIIFAFGIRHVGETMAKTIERHIKSHLYEVSSWSIEEMLSLEDVGPKVAQSIYDFFHNEDNLRLLEELKSLGVIFDKKVDIAQEGSQKFSGKTFLVTGTLENFKRSEIESMIESNGGKILSGVSAKLNYLIVGADAGSKLEKAKKLGTVKLLSESDIITMIQEGE